MTDLLQARSEELLQAVRRLGFLILIGAGVALGWALYAGWGRMSLLLWCGHNNLRSQHDLCRLSQSFRMGLGSYGRDFSCPHYWAIPEQSLGYLGDRRWTCSHLRAFPRVHLPWRYFFAHYAWGLSN